MHAKHIHMHTCAHIYTEAHAYSLIKKLFEKQRLWSTMNMCQQVPLQGGLGNFLEEVISSQKLEK